MERMKWCHYAFFKRKKKFYLYFSAFDHQNFKGCENHAGWSAGFGCCQWQQGENRRQFLHSIYELEITNFSLCGIVHEKWSVFSSVFQLLDCFSIPTVLILSCTVLRARYRLTHIGGMALGLMSVVALVWTDVQDGRGGVSAGGKCYTPP